MLNNDDNALFSETRCGRKSVSVVIVAFESAHLINKALASLGRCHEIICMDNASTDNLFAILSDRDIIYVRNGANLGYARACNQGAAIASGDFVLFMNPDVELGPGAIDALIAAAVGYPDADVFVPRTVLDSGALWFHDVTELEAMRAPAAIKLRRIVVGDCCIRFVDGGIFLIRRSVFLELGGFDENIFMYYEDDDLSLRLLEDGHTIIHVNDALAIHSIGSSSRPMVRYLVRREFHKKRSERYFNRKYGIEENIILGDFLMVAKIVFYCISLRPKRVLAAFGRLIGSLSWR